MKNSKKITVAICTYNRAELLKEAIQSIVDQSVDQSHYDILVVDNNSKDNTKQVVEDFAKKIPIAYVFEEKQGLSYARNTAILNIKTDYIAFIDDDSLADKDWIKKSLKIIEEKKPDIFGGQYIPFYKSPKPKWFKDKYEIRKISDESTYLKSNQFLAGSNIFFRKEIFDVIGYFDKDLGMTGDQVALGEETQLQSIANLKGIKRYYDPELIILNLVPDFKMHISYIIRRYFAAGATARKTFKDQKFGFTANIKMIIIAIVLLVRDILCYPFRNRDDYPYWQNYFVEKIVRHVGVVGHFYQYFQK